MPVSQFPFILRLGSLCYESKERKFWRHAASPTLLNFQQALHGTAWVPILNSFLLVPESFFLITFYQLLFSNH